VGRFSLVLFIIVRCQGEHLQRVCEREPWCICSSVLATQFCQSISAVILMPFGSSIGQESPLHSWIIKLLRSKSSALSTMAFLQFSLSMLRFSVSTFCEVYSILTLVHDLKENSARFLSSFFAMIGTNPLHLLHI
jgi:hypothetical protein